MDPNPVVEKEEKAANLDPARANESDEDFDTSGPPPQNTERGETREGSCSEPAASPNESQTVVAPQLQEVPRDASGSPPQNTESGEAREGSFSEPAASPNESQTVMAPHLQGVPGERPHQSEPQPDSESDDEGSEEGENVDDNNAAMVAARRNQGVASTVPVSGEARRDSESGGGPEEAEGVNDSIEVVESTGERNSGITGMEAGGSDGKDEEIREVIGGAAGNKSTVASEAIDHTVQDIIRPSASGGEILIPAEVVEDNDAILEMAEVNPGEAQEVSTTISNVGPSSVSAAVNVPANDPILPVEEGRPISGQGAATQDPVSRAISRGGDAANDQVPIPVSNPPNQPPQSRAPQVHDGASDTSGSMGSGVQPLNPPPVSGLRQRSGHGPEPQPDPAIHTLDQVKAYTALQVADLLEDNGLFARSALEPAMPALRAAFLSHGITGVDLVENGHRTDWSSQYLTIVRAVKLSAMIRELYNASSKLPSFLLISLY